MAAAARAQYNSIFRVCSKKGQECAPAAAMVCIFCRGARKQTSPRVSKLDFESGVRAEEK